MNNKPMFLASLLCLLASCATPGATKRDHVVFYVWGDASEISNYEKIAKDFETETGFKVKVEPSTGSYYDNLNISFSSSSKAPDIYFTEPGEFVGHVAADKVLDLAPYIEEKVLDVKNAANPNGKIELWDLNDAYRYDGSKIGSGSYHALIKDYSPDFVLWYNKSHIDEYNAEHGLSKGDAGFMEYPSSEVALSWDEFLDMSSKLKKGSRYGTMLDRVPYKHVMEWVQMNGTSFWTEDGKHFNAEDPKLIEAFQFFADLQIGEKASSPLVGPVGIGSGQRFANGDLSFTFFGSYAYSTYGWDSLDFEFGIAPAPTPNGGSELYHACSGMIALAVNKDSTVKDEAVSFLNYYMTRGAEYMAKKGFNIPGNKLVAESEDFMYPESSELAMVNQYFLNLTASTHPLQFNQEIPALTIEDILGKHFSSYLSNPSSSTVEDVLIAAGNEIAREL